AWPGEPLALTPDHRWAVLGRLGAGPKLTARLVNLTDGREQRLAQWDAQDYRATVPRCLAPSPDGEWAGAHRYDPGGIDLWELPAGRQQQLSDEPADCTHLAFRTGAAQLITLGGDLAGSPRQVLLWDLKTPAAPRVIIEGKDLGNVFALSPGGQRLACPSG